MSTLRDIISAFDTLAPEDRLPWLIEFGNNLQPLSPALRGLRDAGEYIVHECQAPVFLKVLLEDDDKVRVEADVPREAPVARGFAGLLQQAFAGLPRAAADDWPADLLEALQIRGLLGMQRQIGLTAIYTSLIQQIHNE